MKSLSKGSNPKKDLLSATLNPRDSTTLPLTVSTFEANVVDVSTETNRFGWSKQIETETSLPFTLERGLGVREEGHLPSGYVDHPKEQRGRGYSTGGEFDFSQESYEQDKSSWKKGKPEIYTGPAVEDKPRKVDAKTKWKDLPDMDEDGAPLDDSLDALLKVRGLTFHISFLFFSFCLSCHAIIALFSGRGRSCGCSSETGGGDD